MYRVSIVKHFPNMSPGPHVCQSCDFTKVCRDVIIVVITSPLFIGTHACFQSIHHLLGSIEGGAEGLSAHTPLYGHKAAYSSHSYIERSLSTWCAACCVISWFFLARLNNTHLLREIDHQRSIRDP